MPATVGVEALECVQNIYSACVCLHVMTIFMRTYFNILTLQNEKQSTAS